MITNQAYIPKENLYMRHDLGYIYIYTYLCIYIPNKVDYIDFTLAIYSAFVTIYPLIYSAFSTCRPSRDRHVYNQARKQAIPWSLSLRQACIPRRWAIDSVKSWPELRKPANQGKWSPTRYHQGSRSRQKPQGCPLR
jgi:hypothetical protein